MFQITADHPHSNVSQSLNELYFICNGLSGINLSLSQFNAKMSWQNVDKQLHAT